MSCRVLGWSATDLRTCSDARPKALRHQGRGEVSVKTLLTESLADPDDRTPAFRDRLCDPVVSLSFISLEQSQGPLHCPSRRSASIGDFIKAALLGFAQLDSILACRHVRKQPRQVMLPNSTHLSDLCQNCVYSERSTAVSLSCHRIDRASRLATIGRKPA